MTASRYIIPCIVLASLVCLANDPIAEIAGICDENTDGQLHLTKIEIADFTNAVIASDGTDGVRTLYKLSRDGDRWKTVDLLNIDLSLEFNGSYFGNVSIEEMSDFFCGLNRKNTICISMKDGNPKIMRKYYHDEGLTETIELFDGVRRCTPSDYVVCGRDDFGMYTYFDWPAPGYKRSKMKSLGVRLFNKLLLIARYKKEGEQAEYWEFAYRHPPTLDEIRYELRKTRDMIKQKGKISLSAPLKTD